MAHGNVVAIGGCGGVDVRDIFAAYDRYLGVYERTGGVGALRTLHEFSKGTFWRGVPGSSVLSGGGHVGVVGVGADVEGAGVDGRRPSDVREFGSGSVDVVGGTVEGGSVGDSRRQVVGGQCSGGVRGPNYARNEANRQRRKKAKAEKFRRGAEFSRLSASGQADAGLGEAWVERKVREHKLKAEQARVALERLLKREQAGEIDRQVAITKVFQEKQLAGVVALRPDPRVAGWAKTVRSGSTTSAAGWAKTVRSGGATSTSSSSSYSSLPSSGRKSVGSGSGVSVSSLSREIEVQGRKFEELRSAYDKEKKIRKQREEQLEKAAVKLVELKAQLNERNY